jgi:hypothetical protein
MEKGYRKYSIMIIVLFFCCGLTYAQDSKYSNIVIFDKNEHGSGYIHPQDNELLVSKYIRIDKEFENLLIWFQNNSVIKEIENGKHGTFSPDGSYYSYILSNFIWIYNTNEQYVGKLTASLGDVYDPYYWSYDSIYIYLCERYVGSNFIYRYEVLSGKRDIVFKSKEDYFHPVTVKNPNIIYMLKDQPTEPGSTDESHIVKYDLFWKSVKKVKIPVKDYLIKDAFTISPDERYAMWGDYDGNTYVVDLKKNKVIDKFSSREGYPNGYSWKADSSAVLYNLDEKKIVLYRIAK